MPLQSAMLPAGPASPAARVVWDVGEQGQALLAVLFPHLAGLRVHRVEDAGDAVMIVASCRAEAACCPRCGQESARVHGGYARMVADGAAGGRPVLIVLQVRRFRCRNPACPAVTFAEQAAGLSERYRRRSVPLRRCWPGSGWSWPGAPPPGWPGPSASPCTRSTVLRLVMAAAGSGGQPPRREVLGVDDFALRKGHVYGTVLVDMRTGDVIDLLPDREAATLEAWLKAHPGAAVICRDRAGAYAEGARDGAPGAIQVADRWHLWHNLAEYAEKTVARASRLPEGPARRRQPAKGRAGSPRIAAGRRAGGGTRPPGPDGSLDVCGRDGRLATRTRERYAEIQRAAATPGEPQAAIRRITGLDRRTVQRFARAASADELLAKATGRESKLDQFKPYLHQRWNEGITDAAVLHAELRSAGLDRQRADRPPLRPASSALPAGHDAAALGGAPAPTVRPKTRRITRWLLTRPDHLQPTTRPSSPPSAPCPHIDALAAHVTTFAEMMTARTGGATWKTGSPPSKPTTRPAGLRFLRHRHPPRPGSRHQRPHPALQLRQMEGKVNMSVTWESTPRVVTA